MLFLQLFRDILRGDGAEDLAVFSGFCLNLDGQTAELLRDRLRGCLFLGLLLRRDCFLLFQTSDVAVSCFGRVALRQEQVSRVAVADLYHIAGFAGSLYISI